MVRFQEVEATIDGRRAGREARMDGRGVSREAAEAKLRGGNEKLSIYEFKGSNTSVITDSTCDHKSIEHTADLNK